MSVPVYWVVRFYGDCSTSGVSADSSQRIGISYGSFNAAIIARDAIRASGTHGDAFHIVAMQEDE